MREARSHFGRWLAESALRAPPFPLSDWPIAADWYEDDPVNRKAAFHSWLSSTVVRRIRDIENEAESHISFGGHDAEAVRSVASSLEFYWHSLVRRNFSSAASLVGMMRYEVDGMIRKLVSTKVGDIDHENLIDPWEYLDNRRAEEEADIPACVHEAERQFKALMSEIEAMVPQLAARFGWAG